METDCDCEQSAKTGWHVMLNSVCNILFRRDPEATAPQEAVIEYPYAFSEGAT